MNKIALKRGIAYAQGPFTAQVIETMLQHCTGKVILSMHISEKERGTLYIVFADGMGLRVGAEYGPLCLSDLPEDGELKQIDEKFVKEQRMREGG